MSASREKKKRKELLEAENASGKKKKRVKKPLSKKAKARIGYAVLTVVIVIFAGLIVFNSGLLQKNLTAVTVGSHQITPAEFNYYYKDAVSQTENSYGSYLSYFLDTTKSFKKQQYSDTQTWDDYFVETAINNAQQVCVLCDEASSAGYTLSDDDQSTVDSLASNIETSATSAGYDDGDAYLKSLYGKGSSVDSYVAYVKNEYIASGYATEEKASFSYTDDDLEAYYDDNKSDFDVVNYRYYLVDGSATTDADGNTIDSDTAMANAKTTADSIATQSQGNESAFIQLVKDNVPTADADTYADDDATLHKNVSKSSAVEALADWLFDASREGGETTTIESDSGYYVVYFISRNRNDYCPVNVRHILIKPSDTSDDSSWTEAEEKAQSILSDYESGDQTEDAFATLANNNSEDTGSNTNGGLYENVYKGEMYQEFEDWCFDSSRQPGDTGIVKSSVGYHVMYFVSTSDTPYWKTQVDTTMRGNDYDDWYTSVSSDKTPVQNKLGLFFTNR